MTWLLEISGGGVRAVTGFPDRSILPWDYPDADRAWVAVSSAPGMRLMKSISLAAMRRTVATLCSVLGSIFRHEPVPHEHECMPESCDHTLAGDSADPFPLSLALFARRLSSGHAGQHSRSGSQQSTEQTALRRYVVSRFMAHSGQHSAAMLPPEAGTLAIIKWRLAQLSSGNRAYLCGTGDERANFQAHAA
jgi:hypothetical protein